MLVKQMKQSEIEPIGEELHLSTLSVKAVSLIFSPLTALLLVIQFFPFANTCQF